MTKYAMLLAALLALGPVKSGTPPPVAASSVKTGTATLNFGAVSVPPGCATVALFVSVTGAVQGRPCAVGRPSAFNETPGGTPLLDAFFECWVDSADTVAVKYCNLTESGDPASVSFTVAAF